MVKLFRLMHGLVPTTILFALYCPLQASTLFFSGNLRTDATDTSCGQNCTLGAANSADDYAQYAAVINTFVVTTTTTMEAITYSYAGNVSRNGTTVAAGGLEPYLSLFDSSGDFLASTYLGTTCPAGSHTLNGNCFDVALDGGTLTPGTYEIALTAYANMSLAENNGAPNQLSDGFTGLGTLATGENLNYAFDVILPSNVTTPEPLSVGLIMIGFALLPFKRRRASRP